MSQTGQIVSVSPLPYGNDWAVDFIYQLDAGGTQQGSVVVGNTTPPPAYSPLPNSNPLTAAMWASPTSTTTVNPNPGTTNPVQLACPDLIKAAAFGVSIKGVPTQ